MFKRNYCWTFFSIFNIVMQDKILGLIHNVFIIKISKTNFIYHNGYKIRASLYYCYVIASYP